MPRAGKIGIAQIDADHQDIVEALEALRQHLDDAAYDPVAKLQELVALLTAHFRREEDLMRQAEYPQADRHAYHHAKTIVEIQDVVSRVDSSGDVDIVDLRSLYKVLIDDIFPADLHFQEYLVGIGRLK
ncbi:bacteriohemerythrin [Hwanghaeella grinnelliae]|uniref:bacteriohemerythrin n=1 Tax=Hwanghaeella grinnelliae TaxID=2500179 RepID=UPI0013866A62|nr:hemerythrin domain-containing protein [Hwanghaeella grinnelliae]